MRNKLTEELFLCITFVHIQKKSLFSSESASPALVTPDPSEKIFSSVKKTEIFILGTLAGVSYSSPIGSSVKMRASISFGSPSIFGTKPIWSRICVCMSIPGATSVR